MRIKVRRTVSCCCDGVFSTGGQVHIVKYEGLTAVPCPGRQEYIVTRKATRVSVVRNALVRTPGVTRHYDGVEKLLIQTTQFLILREPLLVG